jgi:thymidylate synthase ThyX
MSTATRLTPSQDNKNDERATDTQVFAVHGADPEVQAYAMAKYSRSALSMKESLKEISEQKAEQFLNTFYFQYGHRSIADLAHAAFAIERLSLLAAIALVDEQRWDGQERSTRYQNFKKSGFYTPEFADTTVRENYDETARFLFAEYEHFSGAIFEYLKSLTPRPEEMKQDAYDRTLKARAFDISRYLLPLAANTSLGQIVNSRTLETQVSRLLSSEYAEVRQLGELLKQASREPAYNVNHARMEQALDRIRAMDPALAAELQPELLREVRVSPTLVKYAAPNEYEMKTRAELRTAAAELMSGARVERTLDVVLLEDDPLEIELAATLVYANCHFAYPQVRERVQALSAARRAELIALGTQNRGKHDELLRPFSAGQKFRFDVCMDIGGFRDMHRHRRCTQIDQGFTWAHGYDQPQEIASAGLASRYQSAMQRAQSVAEQVAAASSELHGHYLMPLAFRKRCLFSMDFAEVLYISELRTTEAGHFSYRNVAYAMYQETAKRYPALASIFRVTDVRKPVDLLKR